MTHSELAAMLQEVQHNILKYSEHPAKHARKLRRLRQRAAALQIEIQRAEKEV